MEKLLQGKKAIVTGGSRGIGRAICLAFAGEGADVLFTYVSNDDAASETAAMIEAAGARCLRLRGDGRDPGFAAMAAESAVSELGGVDILVNNAGITRDGLMLRMKPEDFDDVISANLSAAFYMTSAVSKFMIKARSGRIINMASIAGVRGNAGQTNYAASKAGIIGLTLSAAKELAPRGITVNAIAPGLIDTDMAAALTDEQRERTVKQIGLGRLGSAGDVADLVVFLASDRASYITGQTIGIDGGLVL